MTFVFLSFIFGENEAHTDSKKESHSETMTKYVFFFPSLHYTVTFPNEKHCFFPFFPLFSIYGNMLSVGRLRGHWGGRVGGRGSQRRRWRSYAYMYPPHIRKREKRAPPSPLFRRRGRENPKLSSSSSFSPPPPPTPPPARPSDRPTAIRAAVRR